MHIQTSRFGLIQVHPADKIEFPEGLLGFQGLKTFVLLDDPNDGIFAWLQSCENKDVSFPILEPELFAPNYKVRLTKTDSEALANPAAPQTRVFAIITIPDDPTMMTANLKAPIIINTAAKKGRQCVLQENDLPIREAIFQKLQQRLAQSPFEPLKVRSVDWGVTVKVPAPAAPKVEV